MRKERYVSREGRAFFLNRAAAVFCWLNGKTDVRKREKNERRGKERVSEQAASAYC